MTSKEWIASNHSALGDAAKRIAKGNPLHSDLTSEVIIAFLEHKDAELITQSGGAWFFCLRICVNLWKSQTSPFYKKYKWEMEQLNPSHDRPEEPEEDTEGILAQIDTIIDTQLSWYEGRLLESYVAEGKNVSALARKTGIPRTSITLTLTRIRNHIQKSIIQ